MMLGNSLGGEFEVERMQTVRLPSQWVVHQDIERVGRERPNTFCGLLGPMSFGG